MANQLWLAKDIKGDLCSPPSHEYSRSLKPLHRYTLALGTALSIIRSRGGALGTRPAPKRQKTTNSVDRAKNLEIFADTCQEKYSATSLSPDIHFDLALCAKAGKTRQTVLENLSVYFRSTSRCRDEYLQSFSDHVARRVSQRVSDVALDLAPILDVLDISTGVVTDVSTVSMTIPESQLQSGLDKRRILSSESIHHNEDEVNEKGAWKEPVLLGIVIGLVRASQLICTYATFAMNDVTMLIASRSHEIAERMTNSFDEEKTVHSGDINSLKDKDRQSVNLRSNLRNILLEALPLTTAIPHVHFAIANLIDKLSFTAAPVDLP